MQEKIIIEFVGDTTELEPAIDQLEAIGQIDKKTADAFRATNKALKERGQAAKGLADGTKAQAQATADLASKYEALTKSVQNSNKTLTSGASSQAVKGFYEGIGDALQEAGISAEQFATKLKNAPKEGEKPVVSLRTQLRLMKQELATLDPNSKAFKDLAARAAEAEDQMQDINAEIRNLASDSRSLDGVVQSVQGVAGAFQLAQGASALFGDENEELQKTMVKLTGLLNISTGLQQLQNLLQKESSAILLITNAQRKIQNASIALEGALQSKNVIVKKAATVAQWALNAAMRANPAGLLLTAIAAVAGALLYFTRNTDDAADKQKELNEQMKNALKYTEIYEEQMRRGSNEKINNIKTEIALRKSQGASAIDLAKLEKKIADETLDQATRALWMNKTRISNIKQLEKAQISLEDRIQRAQRNNLDEEVITSLQDQLSIVNDQIADYDRLTSAVSSAKIAQLQAADAVTQAEKEAADAAQKKLDDANAKAKELAIQRLEDQKAVIQIALNEVKKGTEEEVGLRLALIQKQAEIDLMSLEGTKNTEAQRNKIISDATKEAADIKQDAAKETIEKAYEANNKLLQSEVNLVESALSTVAKGTEQELKLKQELVEAKADLDRSAAMEVFDLSGKTANDMAVLNSKMLAIDAAAIDEKKQLQKEYYDYIEELRQAEIKAEEEAQKQMMLDLASRMAEVALFIANAENRRIQDSINRELSALKKKKDAELSNKRLTDAQKAKLEEDYQKKEAALKLRAWKAQQKAAKTQALVQGALAVVQTLASVPFPYNIIAAAITAGLVIAQVSEIDKQPPPEFAKGVEYLNGQGTGTSDSIHAKLSKGERVVTARENKDYWDTLHAIHNRTIPPDVMNGFAKYGYPSIDSSATAPPAFDIDYRRLGREVADSLYDDLDSLNASVIQASRDQVNAMNRFSNAVGKTSAVSHRYTYRPYR